MRKKSASEVVLSRKGCSSHVRAARRPPHGALVRALVLAKSTSVGEKPARRPCRGAKINVFNTMAIHEMSTPSLSAPPLKQSPSDNLISSSHCVVRGCTAYSLFPLQNENCALPPLLPKSNNSSSTVWDRSGGMCSGIMREQIWGGCRVYENWEGRKMCGRRHPQAFQLGAW